MRSRVQGIGNSPATGDDRSLPQQTGRVPGRNAVLALQRSAGNAALAPLLESRAKERAASASIALGSPVVQRAIMSIDGKDDDDDAKAITRNCLSVLKTKKQVLEPSGQKAPKFHSAGDARGSLFGPGEQNAVRAAAWAGIAGGQVAPDETLYILGHGSGLTVAGLDASEMAEMLERAFGRLPSGVTYRGKLKLVACYGASLKVDNVPVNDPTTGAPIQRPYASELASAISARPGRFRPSSVDGIAGISWVDEATGRLTGFDVTNETELNPLDWVYQSNLLPAWFAALKETDFTKRRAAMDRVLDMAHHRLGKTKLERRVIGKAAKKRYAVA